MSNIYVFVFNLKLSYGSGKYLISCTVYWFPIIWCCARQSCIKHRHVDCNACSGNWVSTWCWSYISFSCKSIVCISLGTPVCVVCKCELDVDSFTWTSHDPAISWTGDFGWRTSVSRTVLGYKIWARIISLFYKIIRKFLYGQRIKL